MRMVLFTALAATAAGSVYASDMATPEEARAMSLKAQAAVTAMGREKAFAAFADPNGDFRDRDLYVFCIDMDGRGIALAAHQARTGGEEHVQFR